MKTVLVWNMKGGVLKSTVAVLMAQYAAKQGLKVLLIDGDLQGDSSQRFVEGYDGEPGTHPMAAQLEASGASNLTPSAADLFDPDPSVMIVPYPASDEGYIKGTKKNGEIFVLPNSVFKWNEAEHKLTTGEWSPSIAYERLNDPRIADSFDLVIIDTSPSLTFFLDALFTLPSDVIIPVDNCENALKGLLKVREKCELENAERASVGRDPINLAGIIPVRLSMFRGESLIGSDKGFYEALKEGFGDIVYPVSASIRHSTFMKEKSWGQVLPRSILDEKNSRAANVKKSAHEMCKETIKRLGFK